MRKVILLFILFLSYPNYFCQSTRQNSFSNNNGRNEIVNRSGVFNNDSEILKIIVEFKDPPAVKLQRSLQKTIRKNIRSVQFQNDLSKISEKLKNSLNKTNIQNITINKEFYKVFSGVQVDVPKIYLNYISSLSYVKKIFIDQKISANLDESVSLINADKIWNQYSDRGAGVKISIIDTGIDYFHDALGNGFGAGYKVIGGHDFVNNDNDPIDDHGHGTHVAGIVAANSPTLKGVAPDALLIACKVLDAKGSGYSSSIIEAIDYSIDPNNDGDFSDAADIINMSLSGAGTPDDPASEAVNNASDLGVVVCVAAGNNGGMGFFTIGSPACAEKAITVGNSTKYKVLETTSSRGPNTINYSIKPDILAPGFNIKSCKLGGGTISYSGTSMASPHIAGVCALIKKQHPEWTPDEIKSAVKTTAEKLNYEPMEQGSGFVNAYKAINIKTFIYPTDLSFGKCDTTNAIWTVSKTLKIKNISTLQQQYNINSTSGFSGISFIVDKPSFSLSAGDSTLVKIDLSVNNSMVGFKNYGSNSYDGYLQVYGTRDTLSIPWAFIKRQMIELKFKFPYANFSLSNRRKDYRSYDAEWPDLYTAQFTIPQGNYDLITCMGNNDSAFFCIKNNLTLSGTEVITITSEESKNKIHLDSKDEYGRKILDLKNENFGLQIFNKKGWPGYLCFFNQNRIYSCFISDIPEDFLLHCYQYNREDEFIRVISHEPVSNQASDIFFTNSPEELVKQKIKILCDKNAPEPGLSLFINMSFTSMGVGDFNDFDINNNFWEGYVVRNKRICSNPSFEFRILAWNSLGLTTPKQEIAFGTPVLHVNNNHLIIAWENEITPDLYVEEDPNYSVVLGDGIVFPKAEYAVNSNYFTQKSRLLKQMGEMQNLTYEHFKAYNSNGDQIGLIENGLPGEFGLNWDGNYLKTEFYQTNYSRFVDSSLAILTSIIKNNSTDYAPPTLSSFQIRNSQGRPVSEITADEFIQVRYSLLDPNLKESSIKFEYKDYYSNNWAASSFEKITVNPKIGNLYSAKLDSGNFKKISLLSFKISYEDNNGNSGSFLLNPAIKINKGNYYPPKLYAIKDTTMLEDDTLSLNITCVDLDNDQINFQLVSKSPNIKYEVSNSGLKIIPATNWFGTDDICLVASDGKYSDSTKFKLTVIAVNDCPGNYYLVDPHNESKIEINESNKFDTLYFHWSKSIDPDGDKLKYYLNANIGSISIDSALSTNTFKIPYSLINKYLVNEGKSDAVLSWKIFVTDGIDTVYAINNPFKIFVSSTITGVTDKSLPTKYCLYNAYPNPFNPTTVIEYDIKESASVELVVYDLMGETVKRLVKENQKAGKYKVVFNAEELSSGVYFYRLKTRNFTGIKKLILMK